MPSYPFPSLRTVCLHRRTLDGFVRSKSAMQMEVNVTSASSRAVEAFAKRAAGKNGMVKKRPAAWHTWPAAKKRHVAALFAEHGYKNLQRQFEICPPRSTIRGWHGCVESKKDVKTVGRPTMLSHQEELALKSAVADVRKQGSVVDREGVILMATSVLTAMRQADGLQVNVYFFPLFLTYICLHRISTWLTSPLDGCGASSSAPESKT